MARVFLHNVRFFLVVIWAAAIALASPSRADLVASHVGDASPTTKGWTEFLGTGGSAIGVNDGGTLAWSVSDSSSVGGSAAFYRQDVPAADDLEGATNGWLLSATLRLPQADTTSLHYSPSFSYDSGTAYWAIGFHLDNDGDTRVRLFTTATGTVSSGHDFEVAGNNEYNTFQLLFSPDEGDVDFFINGTEVFSGFGGITFGPNVADAGITFGGISSLGTGTGNFAAVSFETDPVAIPEASSFVCFGLVSLVGGMASIIRCHNQEVRLSRF